MDIIENPIGDWFSLEELEAANSCVAGSNVFAGCRKGAKEQEHNTEIAR
jgi:hypothetical protein